MIARDHFKAQSKDVFLCSFPKTGSTWLRSLAFAIATRKRYKIDDNSLSSDSDPFLKQSPHDLILCLEHSRFNSCDPNLPIMATHIPYSLLPASIISSCSKLVYICRDPKDVVVSLYHFFKKFTNKNLELNEIYESLCKGNSHFGPYWDHILGYWKASLENPDMVLFLKYEEMKKDTECHVKRLAEFMGYPFSSEEERAGEVEKIARKCSFESLRNLEVNKDGEISRAWGSLKRDAFFRKGEVGDWKNHLSKEMAERIDTIYDEKLSPFGLSLGV